jgi:hypothetical protein
VVEVTDEVVVVVVDDGIVVGAAVVLVVVVDVVVLAVVVDVVVEEAPTTSFTRNVPGRDTAPGPGRSADESTSPLPVAAMQNTDASVAGAATPFVIGPAATPFSVIVLHAWLPKQPKKCPFKLV